MLSTRGITRYRNGSLPCASRARTSPLILRTASSAAIALLLRTTTTMLVSTGPSSRATTATNSCPSSCDCPASPTQKVSWATTEIPTNTATPQINPSGSTPMARTCRANMFRTECTQDCGRTQTHRTVPITAAACRSSSHCAQTFSPNLPIARASAFCNLPASFAFMRMHHC